MCFNFRCNSDTKLRALIMVLKPKDVNFYTYRPMYQSSSDIFELSGPVFIDLPNNLKNVHKKIRSLFVCWFYSFKSESNE